MVDKGKYDMKLFSWFTDANRSASVNNDNDTNKVNDAQDTNTNTKAMKKRVEKSNYPLNERTLLNQAMWPTAKIRTTNLQNIPPHTTSSSSIINKPVDTSVPHIVTSNLTVYK